jgi:UDP-galactopyranose mutase
MKTLILGAGPAGCSTAYALKQKGITDLTIVENDLTGGCSHTKLYNEIPYEFGPQVMYTDELRLQKVFEQFLTQYPPQTADHEYHPALLVDGTLDNIHDFPVTIANVLKHEDPVSVIEELYHINLEKPDYSNFENYMISRIGRRLYEKYIKNYNIKQWKIHPSEMDAEWARFRNLTLRKNSDMFKGKWQGHPGNYNPMWEGMLEDVKFVKGHASVNDEYNSVLVDDSEVIDQYDLIISTLPMHSSLDFINTYKIFVGIKTEKLLMPSYANSFPNNFSFVRIIEYRQQFFIDSDHTLLSFAFPWKENKKEADYLQEVKTYCKDYLKSEIKDLWVWQKENVYPVTGHDTRKKISQLLKTISKTKIIPVGRSGVHAYISKDTCIRMAFIIADNLDKIIAGDKEKLAVLNTLREKLT